MSTNYGTNTNLGIPPLTTQFLDSNGMISTQWYKFFIQFYTKLMQTTMMSNIEIFGPRL